MILYDMIESNLDPISNLVFMLSPIVLQHHGVIDKYIDIDTDTDTI